MKGIFWLLPLFLIGGALRLQAQVLNSANLDTTDIAIPGKLRFNAYVEGYYAYDPSKPGIYRAYASTHPRVNSIDINVAYIDAKYSAQRVRGRLVIGAGTGFSNVISSNVFGVHNILEGTAGYLIDKKREVWVDAGVFASPFTNESAITRDQLTLTRSLAAENVPYVVTGAKVSIPLSPKLVWTGYLLNDFVKEQEQANDKGINSQFEYRPDNRWLLNWNLYQGRNRYGFSNLGMGASGDVNLSFSDMYFIFKSGRRLSATGCFYLGYMQFDRDQGSKTWYSYSFIGDYKLNDKTSLTGRIERFNDPNRAISISMNNGQNGLVTNGASLGLNYLPVPELMLRLEARHLFSEQPVFQDGDKQTSHAASYITAGFNILY